MGTSDLEQMYQEVILEAARNPHGKQSFARDLRKEAQGVADAPQVTLRASHAQCAAGQSHQFNPTCGDEATVRVEIGAATPHRIERVVWDGQGCSISQASLSIMVDLVEGTDVDEALCLAGDFHRMMQSRGAGLEDDAAQERLGDAVVFQGVSKYPMRIKCALLGWEGLKDGVAKALVAQDGGK